MKIIYTYCNLKEFREEMAIEVIRDKRYKKKKKNFNKKPHPKYVRYYMKKNGIV